MGISLEGAGRAATDARSQRFVRPIPFVTFPGTRTASSVFSWGTLSMMISRTLTATALSQSFEKRSQKRMNSRVARSRATLGGGRKVNFVNLHSHGPHDQVE